LDPTRVVGSAASRDLPRLAVCASPLVTVLDGHPHTPAFLSAIKLGELSALGVSKLGFLAGR
jgi:hypothetical protein